jgi:hypothetical protein
MLIVEAYTGDALIWQYLVILCGCWFFIWKHRRSGTPFSVWA